MKQKVDVEFVKAIVDTLHDNFDVREVEVNGVLYRWPVIIHTKDCRISLKGK